VGFDVPRALDGPIGSFEDAIGGLGSIPGGPDSTLEPVIAARVAEPHLDLGVLGPARHDVL
jgi:hypothetical protein